MIVTLLTVVAAFALFVLVGAVLLIVVANLGGPQPERPPAPIVPLQMYRARHQERAVRAAQRPHSGQVVPMPRRCPVVLPDREDR